MWQNVPLLLQNAGCLPRGNKRRKGLMTLTGREGLMTRYRGGGVEQGAFTRLELLKTFINVKSLFSKRQLRVHFLIFLSNCLPFNILYNCVP